MTVSMTQTPPPPAAEPDPMILEALRRVIDDQIGPRGPGALYQNIDGAFEVLAVVRNPERARALLRRRCAQWAVIVRDVLRADGEPFAVGSVWTTEDRLVRAADDACVLCGYWRCRCGEAVAPTRAVKAAAPEGFGAADQRCVCGKPADQCRCTDPYPSGRMTVRAGAVAAVVR